MNEFNILNKSDVSRVKHGASKSQMIPKRERYKWSQDAPHGKFALVNKFELNIDKRYQRFEKSEAKVMEIARDWNWILFGALSVVRRPDGSLWVMDGGHRARASFRRDDVSELPCMVHDLDSLSDEAKAFVEKNSMVSTVSARDRYKAAVTAGDETALKVKSLLDQYGVEVAKGGSYTESQLSCVGNIIKAMKEDEHAAIRVFGFLHQLASIDGRAISGQVYRGMFTLYKHYHPGVDIINRYGDKIARHSLKEIEIRMRQFRAECGKAGSAVEAKAILSLINNRMRNKLEW